MSELLPIQADYRGEWSSFDRWCDCASKDIGPRSGIAHPLCVDAVGRVCFIGKQFMRARDEGTFPVKFYECAAETEARA